MIARTLRRLLPPLLIAPTVFALSATQASAAGETLTLVRNDAAAITGHATNFNATGTLNPDDTMFGFDIFIFAKNPDKDPTCATDFDSESANATHSGGNETWISPATGYQVGYGPAFSQPFKITFTQPGNYLLCGYVKGDFSTFATAQLRGTVAPDPATPAPTPTPAPTTPTITTPPTTTPAATLPAVVRRPSIIRKGHLLTCQPGTWSSAPTHFSYRWSVKGRSRTIASTRKLNVRRSLTGRSVVCRVTARNATGAATASTRAVRA